MVRAQSALRHTGLAGVPMFDVENACASASSAFHLAWLAIRSGQYHTVLVVGAEKLTHPDKQRSFDAIGRAIDLEDVDRVRAEIYGVDAPSGTGTLFMDVYAAITRRYMQASGARPADFAAIAVKNRHHGRLTVGVPRGLPYTASKGGLNAMTRSLAVEWAGRGVRVNGVAP